MLLRLQKDNPEWNVSMAPYWASLPPLGASLTKHTYPQDRLDLLQDKLLVRLLHPLCPLSFSPSRCCCPCCCPSNLHARPLHLAQVTAPLLHVSALHDPFRFHDSLHPCPAL